MAAINPPSNSNSNHPQTTRLVSKRKLDEFNFFGGCDSAGCSTRFRKVSNSNSDSNSKVRSDSDPQSSSQLNTNCTRMEIQFFVRMIYGFQTLVLRANLNDTVEMVHEKIRSITGIPVMEQRLIYRGKQLQWEQTLEECCVKNDSGLQLVGRMRSTEHPLAWRVISDIVSVICRICRREVPYFVSDGIKRKFEKFMGLSNGRGNVKNDRFLRKESSFSDDDDDYDDDDEEDDDDDEIVCVENINRIDQCKIFMEAQAPQALVMLYLAPDNRCKDIADDCIRSFVSFLKDFDGDSFKKNYCAVVVLEFCKLLSMKAEKDDLLFQHCRSTLGSIVKNMPIALQSKDKNSRYNRGTTCVTVQDLFPYLKELGYGLVRSLALSPKSVTRSGPSPSDVCDFSAFLKPVLLYIQCRPTTGRAVRGSEGRLRPSGEESDYLFCLHNELLGLMDKCLNEVDKSLSKKRKKDNNLNQSGWSEYLPILKELSHISEVFPGSENRFGIMMRRYKVAVNGLIVRHAKRTDEYIWLTKHKDLLNFESRSHIAWLMFPEVKEDYEELHEMLIDRSQLLAESFEYISQAKPSSLRGSLFMEFKNEEATGPGVLREWFCLICQAIFDPQNALFLSCPEDRQRFFPNPASKVNPKHLRYFRFAGRVIALALMHKIQVGVVLDRSFFLQLAGRPVSMEDIRDADPSIYNSCKQILEMDAKLVDSDCLGLTFVTEVEEFGSRKVVELCSGGKDIIVNSKNRTKYVDLLIQQHFVVSIAEQVSSFAHGFSDILHGYRTEQHFFVSIEPEDLDWMLRGSGSEICVEDWKAHTDYHGYKKSDPQIGWFWKIVERLNAEQKRNLLFFWTSVKYLPASGFRGLASRLSIHKALESEDHLPSSHTCFYELYIPPYRTKSVLQKRLSLITQEHVGCSFGNS